MDHILFQDYIDHRYTLQELAIKYHRSRAWIQERIHSYSPRISPRTPRKVTAVIDATWFGRRRDKLGLLVAKDVEYKEPIAYNFIATETKEVYRDLLEQLKEKGFVLQAVVLDGKPGIMELFKDIPVQMCHFHMHKIITRKLTKNPRMQAAIDLKRIVGYLGRVSQRRFECMLQAWHHRYADFLAERTPDDSKRGWHYTHKRLRSAYRSLVRFSPYLFTYLNHPKLPIPNTTNLLDGGCFSPLKDLLKVHRGTGIGMKQKIIVYFLENRGKQPHEISL